MLPVPLAVYDGLLPEVIDRSVAEAERRTYWWLFSAINKVWQWMASKIHEPGTLPRFPGFEIVSGWETGALMSAQTGPLAMTISRGDHLIILVSGLPIYLIPLLSTWCSIRLVVTTIVMCPDGDLDPGQSGAAGLGHQLQLHTADQGLHGEARARWQVCKMFLHQTGVIR